MKKLKKASLAILLASTLPLAATVQAEENGGGCGVGKVVMEGKEGKNAHISVSLINMLVHAVIGPVQLFAMTSGTLGCDVTQTVSNDRATENFIAANQDSLIIEIAQGSGVYLESLADLMQVDESDRSEFFSSLQANYETIAFSEDVLRNVEKLAVGG